MRVKDIVGVPGYGVTSDGRVFHLKRMRELKTWGHGGYVRVGPVIQGKQKFMYVHVLVLRTWGETPRIVGQEVNHKNGIKSDNRVENLEWVTRSENSQHAHRTGLIKPLRGEARHNARLTEQDVKRIRSMRGKVREHVILELYPTVSRGAILDVLRDKTWRHVG